MKASTKLFPFQVEGIRRMHQLRGGILLADEPGLGKTIESLKYMEEKLKRRGTVIISCPKIVKWNWQNEARDRFGIPTEILSGSKPPRDAGHPADGRGKVYIINHDILKGWTDWLKGLKADMIIVDECHKFKNRAAKRSKALRSIAYPIKEKVMLSGTPLENNPIELFSTLNLLYPKHFPSFFAFAQEYTNATRTFYGWKYEGGKNLGKLNSLLLKLCMIRRRKKDVLKDLPPIIRTVIPVEISNRKEYDEAQKDFLNWLARKSLRKAMNAAGAEALAKIGYLKRLVAQLKLPSVMDWIDNFLEETNEKLIVFGIHKDILKPLWDRYKDRGVVVHGGITGIKRQQSIEAFQRNPSCRVFIGNIDAAGVGWNGTVASNVFFAELDWVPAKHLQAEARGHRIGSVNPLNAHYMVGKDTIEHRLCSVLQEKQKIFDAAVDGKEGIANLNVMVELTNLLIMSKGKLR